MIQDSVSSLKILRWDNIIFFIITTVLGVIGMPLYVFHFGLSKPEVLLFTFYMIITPLSITIGYHRLFAHATFKAKPLIRFLILFFGAAAFEQSALKWASQHRDHHRYVDTDRDPYDIKKGFFYAHIGWLIFGEHKTQYDNVKDLQKSRLMMHQHLHYRFWAFTSGVLVPILVGAITGHWLGALLLSVCARITFVYHATFCINSVCHMFGKATYDKKSSAKDHWLAALITFGEGYHNFHHRFPYDYRNGVLWYHWDPSKWIIAGMAKLGLVWDLKRVTTARIFEAQFIDKIETLQPPIIGIENHKTFVSV